MAQQPTINDVARAAGVSKGLVSLALNDRPGVAPTTRSRILDAAKALGWFPNPSARGLTKRRAYALGLILRRDPLIIESDPFFSSFIAGVETVLSQHGQVLVLCVVPDGEAETAAYQRLAAEKRVDGFLITDLRQNDERIPVIAAMGVQAVTLGEPDIVSPFPAISRDYDQGISALTLHLMSLGHTRIAHVAGDEHMLHGLKRKERFEFTMQQAGLTPVVVSSDFSPEQGAAATIALLDSPKPPTAIIYGNDPMAIAGMSVAQQRGLRLPEDLSVTGLDGAQIGSYIYPALTTLKNDPAEWGVAAAQMLLRLIDTGSGEDIVLPPAELVLRASTAPVKSH